MSVILTQVKEKCTSLLNQLSNLENALTLAAEENKCIDEIDALEKNVVELLYKCNLVYALQKNDNQTIENFIEDILLELSEDYEKYCFAPSSGLGRSGGLGRGLGALLGEEATTEDTRKRISNFTVGLLNRINKDLDKIAEFAAVQAKIEYSPELLLMLDRINATFALKNLQEWTQYSQGVLSSVRPLSNPYLGNIRTLKIEKVHSHKSSVIMEEMGLEVEKTIKGEWTTDIDNIRRIENNDGTITVQYPFAFGLNEFCSSVLNLDGFVTREAKSRSVACFKREIEKIRPILRKYYFDCISMEKKELEQRFEGTLSKIENIVHEQAQELRKSAEISKSEKQRLSYVRQMQERIEKITCL